MVTRRTLVPERLPDLIAKATLTLANATTAAEVLDAKNAAVLAYNVAKTFARMKGAAEEIFAAARETMGQALVIEKRAQVRLADEYDAAQARGEVAVQGGARNFKVPNENFETTTADLGISRKDIFEARQVRDAEKAEPGIVERTVKSKLAAGKEPTRADVKRVVKAKKVRKTKPVKTAKPKSDKARPPSEQEQIALDYKLPVDTFSSADQKRLCIWISEEGHRAFDKSARELGTSAQAMIATLVAKTIANVPEAKEKQYRSISEISLTREQVDPDFKGSDLEFARKYGNVNFRNKQQIEASKALERGLLFVLALREFLDKVPADIDETDIMAWVRQGKSTERRVGKMVDRAKGFALLSERLTPLLMQVADRLAKKDKVA